MWYPGSDVVLDCIDSQSLPPFLIFLVGLVRIPLTAHSYQASIQYWRYVLIQIWSFCVGRKTSCTGIFAYVCTEKLAFVDYLRAAQKSICTGLEFVRRYAEVKAISYLDHFCARKVGVFASIRNLDLKMKITKVFHAGLFAHLEIHV